MRAHGGQHELVDNTNKSDRPAVLYASVGCFFLAIGIYSLTLTVGLFIPIVTLLGGFVALMAALAASLADETPLEEQINDSASLKIFVNRDKLTDCIYHLTELGIHCPENADGIPCLEWNIMVPLLQKKGYTMQHIMQAFRVLLQGNEVKLKNKMVYFLFTVDTKYVYGITIGKEK